LKKIRIIREAEGWDEEARENGENQREKKTGN